MAKIKPLALLAFVKDVLLRGADVVIPVSVGRSLGLKGDARAKAAHCPAAKAKDGLDHVFEVVIEKVKGASIPIPAAISVVTVSKSKGSMESYLFRAGVTGSLEAAVRMHVKLDKQGKDVPGSSGATGERVDSPGIKRRYQRELEFWLKRFQG